MKDHVLAKWVIVPGGQHLCPLCQVPLSHSEMGVSSHLRKHVKLGELAKADEPALRMKILGATYKTEGDQ